MALYTIVVILLFVQFGIWLGELGTGDCYLSSVAAVTGLQFMSAKQGVPLSRIIFILPGPGSSLATDGGPK